VQSGAIRVDSTKERRLAFRENGAERCRHSEEEDRGVAAGAVIDVRIYVALSEEVIE
jgi:hypothetical protein